MANREIIKFIEDIKENFSESKFFVNFFIKNFNKGYRGNHNFQQDRITIEQALLSLKHLYDISQEDWLLVGPTPNDSDIKPDHPEFENTVKFRCFVNELKLDEKNISPAGNKANPTQMSTKKIFLMNLWAFGLVERKIEGSKGQVLVQDYEQRNNKLHFGIKKTYYKLSEKSIEIINLEEKEAKRNIAELMKSRLLVDDIEILYLLILDERTRIFSIRDIDQTEYAVTLNYFRIGEATYEETISAFLELYQNRKTWLPYLKSRLKSLQEETDKYKKLSNKYSKENSFIDYGNWINQVRTKFNFLTWTGNFRFEKDKLIFNLYGLDEIYNKKERSMQEKLLYFANHNISKEFINENNFQLHHIIPIASARDGFELLEIDTWKNMLYLSPNKHAEFPNRNNSIYFLEFNEGVLNFSDLSGQKKIFVNNGVDSKFDSNLVDEIIKYNKYLTK